MALGKNEQIAQEEVAYLVEKYYDVILGLVRQKVPESDVEDIAQECFRKVCERFLGKGKGQKAEIQKELAWLRRVARNCIADYYDDGEKKTPKMSLEALEAESGGDSFSEAEAHGPEASALYNEMRESIECAIQKLPPKLREVMKHTFEEKTIREIARMTGYPEGTIRAYLTRSRQKIKYAIR